VSFHPPAGRVFNSIINIRNIDFCGFFTNPIFRSTLLNIGNCQDTTPQLCHKCPYVKSEKLEANITINPEYCPLSKNLTQKPVLEKGLWFPDGDYRVVISFRSDDADEWTMKYFFRTKVGDTSTY
jgi:hypothetical protein